MRPTKHTVFIKMAETVALRSHDAETLVGSILVSNKSGDVLGTGYNGFVRGASDHNLPNKRPEKYTYMVHSEMNLICNLARRGVSTEDSTLYCTMSPCVTCMRLLYQSGVTRVICKEKYRDFESLKSMGDLEIEESLTEEGLFEFHYKVK